MWALATKFILFFQFVDMQTAPCEHQDCYILYDKNERFIFKKQVVHAPVHVLSFPKTQSLDQFKNQSITR